MKEFFLENQSGLPGQDQLSSVSLISDYWQYSHTSGANLPVYVTSLA